MRIPVKKTIISRVEFGELELREVDSKDTWGNPCREFHVYYHNHLFKNSPFKCSVTFSSKFTREEITKSSEVLNFLSPFLKD